MGELFRDINGKWSDGSATYGERDNWRPYGNEVGDDPRESSEPPRLSSLRETGHLVRRERVPDAAREALLHRSGDGTAGPEAVCDVPGQGVPKAGFSVTVNQFIYAAGITAGIAWWLI